MLVVVRSTIPRDSVLDLLQQTHLTVSAHATNAVPEGTGNATSDSGKHDIATFDVAASEGAEIVSDRDAVYVVWKPAIHLARPRARLQRPAIYFTANLTPTPAISTGPRNRRKSYLQSYEPIAANVLEPLNFDLTGNRRKVFLSEARMAKVAPSPPQPDDSVKSLRGATKRAFPAIPALYSRIRCSSLPQGVFACLQIEVSKLLEGTVLLDDVHINVPETTVERLAIESTPQRAYPGDDFAVPFKVHRQRKAAEILTVQTASICIKARMSLEESCEIQLDIHWQAQIDMSHIVTSPTYLWSRPLSANSANQKRIVSQQSVRPIPLSDPRRLLGETHLTFTFSAPPTTTQGSEFALRAQCLNMTDRTRIFALVAARGMGSPRRKTARTGAHLGYGAGFATATSTSPQCMHNRLADVLNITPSVQIGPLSPGACYESSVVFKAMTSGLLDLGALKLVDLDSQQTIDVTELPDVVAFEQLEAP